LTGAMVIAATNDFAALHDDGTHHGIGGSGTSGLAREAEGKSHVFIGVGTHGLKILFRNLICQLCQTKRDVSYPRPLLDLVYLPDKR